MNNVALPFAQGQEIGQKPASAAPAKNPEPDTLSEMFMTLLLAQIRNQNPLDPADPAQFVNQLTQMNQVQTSLSMLSELKNNALRLSELRNLTLGAQVGSTVLVKTDVAQLDGSSVTAHITLPTAEEHVALVLTGADNRETVVELGRQQPAGERSFTFTPQEYGLLPGHYALSVLTASKTPVPLELSGVIRAVQLSGDTSEPLLSLAGVGNFPVSSISRFSGQASPHHIIS